MQETPPAPSAARRPRIARLFRGLALLVGLPATLVLVTCNTSAPNPWDYPIATPIDRDNAYHSPQSLAFSPDGKRVAVADRTAGRVVVFDTTTGRAVADIELVGRVSGIAFSADGRWVYAAEFDRRCVAKIDTARGKVVQRFAAGAYPENLSVVPGRGVLLVAGWGSDRVRAIDLQRGKTRADMPAAKQPFDIAVTPDESTAIVTNLLPAGRATAGDYGAVVGLYDLKAMRHRADVALPVGSSAVRGVAADPDGRFAYVVHILGRYNVPTSQVERGWVNTNALSVIDLADATCRATVLLDNPVQGAADPWGLAVSADGRWLCAAISGTHELGLIDLPGLKALIEIGDRAALIDDLAALYRANVIRRVPVDGKGPRGVAFAPDGRTIAAAVYFSGHVAMVDAATANATQLSLGAQPAITPARMGERVFHDGTRCFQNWLSCATCHPGGRVDGLNWDLLNDGLGNPKNARSMVWADRTPPMMWRGVRDRMPTAARAGFRFIQFTTPTDEQLAATIAYIESLEPLPSPHLRPDGSLTAAAKRGEAIFRSSATRCAACHPPPHQTNLRMFDVGTRRPFDRADRFDTPALVELWRTGPYLHDGGAATLREVLVDRNPNDRHGKTSHLTDQQIDDLIEYLLSL